MERIIDTWENYSFVDTIKLPSHELKKIISIF